jgi:hypothetical protein
MKPGKKRSIGNNTDEAFLLDKDMPYQEQFIRQVKDDSLPADQILTEQKEDLAPDDLPPLFVP